MGGVGAAGDGVDAVHTVVDPANRRARRLGRAGVAVRRVEHEADGAVQAAPRVGFVIAVLDDSGHRRGSSAWTSRARIAPTSIDGSA